VRVRGYPSELVRRAVAPVVVLLVLVLPGPARAQAQGQVSPATRAALHDALDLNAPAPPRAPSLPDARTPLTPAPQAPSSSAAVDQAKGAAASQGAKDGRQNQVDAANRVAQEAAGASAHGADASSDAAAREVKGGQAKMNGGKGKGPPPNPGNSNH